MSGSRRTLRNPLLPGSARLRPGHLAVCFFSFLFFFSPSLLFLLFLLLLAVFHFFFSFSLFSSDHNTSSDTLADKQDFTFTVPKNLPSGDYLVRIEHIALHNTGKPQIYVACGQVRVTGGGNGTPGPLVAFPGVYAANDPGVVFNLYGGGQYRAPGPAVWTG